MNCMQSLQKNATTFHLFISIETFRSKCNGILQRRVFKFIDQDFKHLLVLFDFMKSKQTQ